MENKNVYYGIIGVLIFIIFVIAYFSGGDVAEKQYAVLKQLCSNLSDNYPASTGFYGRCMVEAEAVYDKNNPPPQDDHDPYEDAQPGAYGD